MSPGDTALIAWATSSTLFTLVACVRLGRLREDARAPFPKDGPPVLLLRPMDAPSRDELAALASPIEYPGPVEQVVLSPFRPRLPPNVKWLWSDPLTTNRKAGHLAYALSVLRTQGRVVLSIDSDVAVDGALVKALVGPLLRGAALSTVSWLPVPRGGLGARAMRAMLALTHHSFLALHVMSAGAKSISGKAMGLSLKAQREVAHVSGHIGEDLELSHRLHALGGKVTISLCPARAPQPVGAPFSHATERVARWMRVLKAHRPGLYPTVPLLFCPALPLLGLAALGRTWAGLGAVVALFGARTLLARQLAALRPEERSGALEPLEWVLGEALLLASFVRSLFGSKVTWRGREYALLRGGRMRPLPLPSCGMEVGP
ncbi:MAG TPA: glycosyltransferase [Myxococcaceae bacterium]|nr:glycosyltransferase [Myxococcaceae bacterium]